MDYSQLTDDEINIRVGESFGWNAYFLHPDGSLTFRDDKGQIKGKKNYCNNPADAWPIIFSHRIGVAPAAVGDKWAAHYCNWDIAIVDTNPLRAAMIVFLMMQESANVQTDSAR